MLKTRRYPAATSSGNASPELIILVHGAMDRLQSFGRASRRLEEFDCLAYDRRGYAGSLEVGPATDPQQHVDDLFAIADEADANPERTVLVGHSVGGLFALMAAAQKPHRFRAVAAWEPPAPWTPWWPRPASDPALDAPAEEVVEWFYRATVGDAAWERLSARVRGELTAEGPALIVDLLTGRDTPMFDPSRIEVPVLIGSGDLSVPRHLRAAAELTAEIPTATHHVVPGAGHGAHRSNADAFAAFVRAAANLAPLR